MSAARVQLLETQAYLTAYLAPFQAWLARDDVSEILVNAPGELWIERAGAAAMERLEAPDIDDVLMQRLAAQIARLSHQGINREQPLLAASLPDGSRVQIIAPPATRAHWAMAIRRHKISQVPLEAFAARVTEPVLPAPALIETDPITYLKHAVAARQTILISGGTSSGKTTFLNALLREVPRDERIILVEDTAEIQLCHDNAVGLVGVKGDMGEARITADDLLQGALRMRPDRIVLGELRGKEAVSFLRAINTGHPGSFSTLHANTARGALEQLALMVMQTGIGLTRQDVLTYASSIIDVVVQLGRQDGQRGICNIARASDLVD